ncbi:MAG: hypothetical protein AAGF47_02055 [Planctomycetota bacterium]
MTELTSREIIEGVQWWELAGHHDERGLLETWRELHHAVQLVAELGKGWARAEADDSHSTLVWIPNAERLQDQFFASRLAEGGRPARALLRPWDMKLFLIDAAGSPIDSVELEGTTFERALGWVRSVAEGAIGPAVQDAEPAPDLPDHPVASGSAFGEPNQLAIAELIRFYSNADAVLGRVHELLDTESEPVTWPHHFDLAVLKIVSRDASGEMEHTIGFGLTPPDSVSAEGYWYVSPWSRTPGGGAAWPDLPVGRWEPRGDAAPMAVLPASEVSSTEDPAEQHERVAAFIADAYNACRRAIDDG